MKKICLSGAITGHEKEATVYFTKAEEILRQRYPNAEIFNPIKIPPQSGWEEYMNICLDKLQTWADTMVIIKNDYLEKSAGAMIEKHVAFERELDVIYIQVEKGEPA